MIIFLAFIRQNKAKQNTIEKKNKYLECDVFIKLRRRSISTTQLIAIYIYTLLIIQNTEHTLRIFIIIHVNNRILINSNIQIVTSAANV